MGESNVSCYLYILKCSDFIKVGVSNNPDKRINSINAHNPLNTILLFSFCYDKKKNAFLIEKKIHAKLKLINKHHKYEWFTYDEESMNAINTLTKEFDIELLNYTDNNNSLTELITKDSSIYKEAVTLEQIQTRLKDRRLTVISKEIGISYPTLLAISKGQSNPTHKVMQKISDYFERAI